MKFSAVLWFMALWLTFVYAPIAHMVWGGGWLAGLGAKDFAGGTVVHVNAGIAGAGRPAWCSASASATARRPCRRTA